MALSKIKSTSLETDATNLVLLSSTTISSGTASVEFTSGIDSTYKIHVFKLNAIHGTGGNTEICFRASTNGGSSYGVATTCNFGNGYAQEGGTASAWGNEGGNDSHNSTGNIDLTRSLGNGNDEIQSVEMTCYDWSNTTYIKPFNAFGVGHHQADYSIQTFVGGFVNTTSAINAIEFKPNSGTFEDGVITLYGVKT